MTHDAPLPITPVYRLVVTGSYLKARQFVWVIVDDTNRGIPVQTSKSTFRSMEDAYNAGTGALEYWRDKTPAPTQQLIWHGRHRQSRQSIRYRCREVREAR
jgi:hypothetical protein